MTIKPKLRDQRYNIYIMPLAKRKMELYCELCNEEIGWMAYVEKIEGNRGYMITDCVLLKQEVNGGTTEIDPAALLSLWNTITPEQQNKLKCWCHSHVNMSPSPSSQDDSQMKYFEEADNDWFIRIITNKKGEINLDFYDYVSGIEINTDTIYTYQPEFAALRKEITDEIADKVAHKTYASSTQTPSSAGAAARESYDSSDNYYKNRQDKRTQARKASNLAPLFNDINIKYLSSIKEALNDPNYWNPVGAY